MEEIFNKYLTTIQYNKICKYWKYIDKFTYKLDNFDYLKYYRSYEEFSDDEETRIECIKHNEKINYYIQKLREKLNYY